MGSMECYEKSFKRIQIGKISVSLIDWKADNTLESGRSGSQRAGVDVSGADGRKTGCDRNIEEAGSDETGRVNE